MFNENLDLLKIQETNKGSMAEFLGIEIIEFGKDYLKAKMPVDKRTKQPFGILHGGASVVLAETLGSIASYILISHDKNKSAVGLEINANHLKAAKQGFVYGTVRPIHIGRTTHLWDIKITNENEELVSISRLTVIIIDRK